MTTRHLSLTEAERETLLLGLEAIGSFDGNEDAHQLYHRLRAMNFTRHDFNEDEIKILDGGRARTSAVVAFRARTGVSLEDAVDASRRVVPLRLKR